MTYNVMAFAPFIIMVIVFIALFPFLYLAWRYVNKKALEEERLRCPNCDDTPDRIGKTDLHYCPTCETTIKYEYQETKEEI